MLQINHPIVVGDVHTGVLFHLPESFRRKREHNQLLISKGKGKGKRLALTFQQEQERCRTLLAPTPFLEVLYELHLDSVESVSDG